MNVPVVSVVIPVYNGERYIADTLRSVQQQSLKEIEVWVVNDGSTDDTAGIVDEIMKTDSRIRLINKMNTGVSDTRNRGIDASKGTYIAFLDADDIWEKTNLEEKVNAMIGEGKQWAYSNLSFIDDAGKSIDREEKILAEDFYRNLLKWEMVVPGPCSNVIASRELMGEHIRFDVNIPCPSDRDICIQLARKAAPAFVNKKLWRYRVHGQSMTAVNKQVAKEMALMYDKYKSENYFPDRKTRKIALSRVYLIIAGICFRFTKERRRGLSYLFRSFREYPSYFFKNMYRKLK